MNKTNKKEVFHLWWANEKTKKRSYAGRAYYNEEKADYALIINLLESSHQGRRTQEIFLRPITNQNGSTYFRVEKVIQRKDKSVRFSIGEAWQHKENQGDIYINIDPLTNFFKRLVLTIPQQKEVNNV